MILLKSSRIYSPAVSLNQPSQPAANMAEADDELTDEIASENEDSDQRDRRYAFEEESSLTSNVRIVEHGLRATRVNRPRELCAWNMACPHRRS